MHCTYVREQIIKGALFMVRILVLKSKTNCIKQKMISSLQSKENTFKKLTHMIFIIISIIFFLCPIVAKSETIVGSKVYLGEPKKGKQVAEGICAGCHANDGNSIIPTNPILAGQHSAYIKKQLHNFQIKAGNEKAMRENAVMVVFASTLSDEQIADVAAYYNQQKIRPSYSKKKDLALLGESLYKGGDVDRGVPACASCHGPKGAGIPDQYPRVGGKYADYTTATLLSYKKGIRANNKQMMTISKRMSDEQINAVSEYLAGLR
jgi:cytochrome c553